MSSLIIKSKVEIDKWLDQFIIMSQRLFENYDTLVDDIITNVKDNGDDALISLTNEFDNIKLEKDSFYFLEEEINEIYHEEKPEQNQVKHNEEENTI